MEHVAEIAHIIGLFGVAGILAAYGLLSFGVWRVTQPRYVLLNMAGTAAVLLSIAYAWNWPGFVLNASWIIISAVALWRIYRNRASS
jgi:hypothetical protein